MGSTFKKWFRGRRSGESMELSAVFLLTVLVYGWVETTPFFPDPDAFYHAKMALLTLSGPVTSFPWLPLTTLADNFADQQFFYHVLIAPFVFGGGLVGLKVVTVILAAAAITVFHYVLRRLSVRHAWFFTLLLAGTGPMVMRLNLAKASAPAIILVLLAVLAMQRNRRWPLFFLAWLYVWTHGSWPLLAVLAFFDLSACLFSGDESDRWRFIRLRSEMFKLENARAAIIRFGLVLSGLAAGLIMSPFFPSSLWFLWEQTVQVAFLGHLSCVSAGVEWQPFTLIDLFRNAGAVFIAWLLFGVVWLVTLFWRDTTGRTSLSPDERRLLAFTCLSAATTLGMTLLSRRHAEYFLPLSVLALGVSFELLMRRLKPKQFVETLSRSLGGRRPVYLVALLFLGFFLFMPLRSVVRNREMQSRGYPLSYLTGVGEFINEALPDGTMVINVAWEDFPPLFLVSDRHTYAVGLEPNFLYRANRETYLRWSALSEGSGDLDYKRIVEDFGTPYVLLSTGQPLTSRLLGDGFGHMIYADDEAVIIELLAK